jgi:hypothetical protein
VIAWLRRLLIGNGDSSTRTDKAVDNASATVAKVDKVAEEFWDIQRRMKPGPRGGGPRVP